MAHILVIDDDEQIRRLLSIILKKEGHEVSLAENGKVGLAVFEKVHPELVITDVLMPEVEGLETIRQLRQLNPELPIIAITGGGRVGADVCLLTAKKFGAFKTFKKPVPKEELFAAIDEATGNP